MTSFCMSLPDLADMKHTFIPCPSRTKETQACLQAPSPSLGSKDSALRPCDGFCYHQGLDHSTGPLCVGSALPCPITASSLLALSRSHQRKTNIGPRLMTPDRQLVACV